jgi:hypothetical protein
VPVTFMSEYYEKNFNFFVKVQLREKANRWFI